MFKEKKCIMKSVRMTEKVSNYIENYEGDGFNQKLENLVLFCMDNERCIQESIKRYKESLDTVRAELSVATKALRYVRSIENAINEFVNYTDFVIKENCDE